MEESSFSDHGNLKGGDINNEQILSNKKSICLFWFSILASILTAVSLLWISGSSVFFIDWLGAAIFYAYLDSLSFLSDRKTLKCTFTVIFYVISVILDILVFFISGK